MRPDVPPSELTPVQRRNKLAGIFAAGVLRLRKQRKQAGQPTETKPTTSAESDAQRLEVSGETVLSVHTS